MKTTFRELKNHHPCKDAWSKLCNNVLGTDFPKNPTRWKQCTPTKEQMDVEVSILKILENNGREDAFWSLRTQDYKNYCLVLADIAESVLPIWEEEHPDGDKPRKAIEAIRQWHAGKITDKELSLVSKDTFVYTTAAYDAIITFADRYTVSACITAAYASDIGITNARDAEAAAVFANDSTDDSRKKQRQKNEEILKKYLEEWK